ncbi:hypothetical protein SAMN04488136_102123 [Vibrio xiamenensis]|uniref:PilZ domain-containing protein n=1 Tax=Vibrio xiamenensis TaxID=861298 RepID=A0A1G7WR91_9VIBR|nr:PilZ domain-containing protein [Vibrio xiamenensis]SDG74461.1 hypothetical protein SAMN04488136_102123 [Vibrio xiamenensis]
MTEQEYFTVHHQLTINAQPLADDFIFPSSAQFEAEIPAPFVVASEFSQLDMLNDSARKELNNSDFKHVINLLDTQNSKLNLLLTFLLSQQDDPQYRSTTVAFGASQCSYLSATPLNNEQALRVKLFLEHPAAAIYCYARVIGCEAHEQGYLITAKYQMLRDADQDLLIKAALYQQQKLLRQRSIDRENNQ